MISFAEPAALVALVFACCTLAADAPIKIARSPNSTTLLVTSQEVPQAGEVTLAMEQVDAKPWTLMHSPYCTTSSIEETKTPNGLEIVLKGDLDATPGLPYEMRLSYSAEPYRVKIEGDMLEFPSNLTLTAFGTCLQSPAFSKENNPPFEMATQSFLFVEGKGFSWISDAERTRSEYHQGEDDGGPWINLFPPQRFANPRWPKDLAASPLVGWVARDNSYLVAYAAENAREIGIRWGPCLHSNPACDAGTDTARRFRAFLYLLPVDWSLLLQLYKEDFPKADTTWLKVTPDSFWPYKPGALVGSFEGADLEAWQVSKGRLSAYQSQGIWINGNSEKVKSPEGVTEGKGAALLEADGKEAEITRSLTLPAGATHLSLDAINRTTCDVTVTLSLSPVGPQCSYILRSWANRRLLLPVNESGEMTLTLKATAAQVPFKLVLDNLRIFSQ